MFGKKYFFVFLCCTTLCPGDGYEIKNRVFSGGSIKDILNGSSVTQVPPIFPDKNGTISDIFGQRSDEATNSLDLLNLILQKTLNGYLIFNAEVLYCFQDCLSDPSSMQIVALPKCLPAEVTHSAASWFANLQSNFDHLQVYQFYLNNYNTTVPKQTQDDLNFVASVLPNFETVFSYDVYQRTCDFIQEVNMPFEEIPMVMPSKILEDSRTYEFLRQFTEFLGCFHNLYSVFWWSYQISC